MEDKQKTIRRAQSEANAAKDRLIQICNDLYEVGAVRKAKSLEIIICRLESWQNK